MNEREARRIVRQRSDGGCEVRILPVCLGRATNFQHRKARGQGGQWAPSNGLDVCGAGNASGCHGYIHQHPTEAYANGWSVESWAEPALRPFLHWNLGMVLPDEHGDFHFWRGEVA